MIYLSAADPAQFKPWGTDLVAAIGDRHDLGILDRQQSVALQLENVDVVIDMGGDVRTREMVGAAKSIRLWQILGTGLVHFDADCSR